jgi:formylmethanofuran dehydrogenase subunit E
MSQKRRSRAPQDPAPSTTPLATPHSSVHQAEDGYSAPTPDDRLDAEVVAAAKERGFSIAVRCSRCNQWVVAAKSVALHMGPVCRAKAVPE